MVKSPFFIVSVGRSGSTFLRKLLNNHSRLFIPGETKELPYRFKPFKHHLKNQDYEKAARVIKSFPQFKNWAFDTFEPGKLKGLRAEKAYGEAFHQVMQRGAEAKGKARWGEKTPHYINHVPFIKKLFPDAKFIHIYRDGRDMLTSVMPLKWGPNNAYMGGKWWRQSIEQWQAAKKNMAETDALEFKYEAFLQDPEKELKQLLDFLEEPYEEQLITNTTIETNNFNKWKNKFWMGQLEVQAFEAAAGDLLSQLGYERMFAKPQFPLHLRAFSHFDDLYKRFSNRVLRNEII